MSLTQLPPSVYRAILRRELTTTLHNRFVHVFAILLWVGSIGVGALSGRAEAVPFGLLLLFLYVVPLFGLLVSVSAAHEEDEERAFLWSQPIPRWAYVVGKAFTLSLALAVVLLGALVGAATLGAAFSTLALLWALGVALALVSVSAGIAVGQYTTSRARGLMVALVVWFGAFALYDALALVGAGIGSLQALPGLWVGLLALNPVDAVRLAGLFGLESVPFSVPGDAAWLADVLPWLPAWVFVLTVGWTGGLLVLACRRLQNIEL